MKSLEAFFKLVRWQNLLVIILTMYLIRYNVVAPLLEAKAYQLQMPAYLFFVLVMSTVLIAAAGYIINDYFDRKTDLVNRPGRVVVGTVIKRRTAMAMHSVFNVLGFLAGAFVAWRAGAWKLAIIFVLVQGMLWFYSTSYKRQMLVGNVVISVITALVPLMAVLFELPMLRAEYEQSLLSRAMNLDYIFFIVLGFTFFAFTVSMVREIIKDIEDLEGDNAYGCNTLPIAMGVNTAKSVVISFLAIAIVAIIYVFFNWMTDIYSFSYFIALLVLPMIYLIIKVQKARSVKQYHAASTLAKLIMLAGIFYSFLLHYNIGQGLLPDILP